MARTLILFSGSSNSYADQRIKLFDSLDYMAQIFRLILLTLLISPVVFSQIRKDLDDNNLRSNVHQINYYDVYYKPDFGEKYLTAIAVYNRNGNLRVNFEFSRQGKNCFYKKTVYSYDTKNRRKTQMLYQSETGENICPRVPPIFQENEVENLAGTPSLIEQTNYEYQDKDRISRDITFDQEGRIILQNNYAYNRRGENVRITTTQQKHRFASLRGNFVKTMEFRMSYRNKGRVFESSRYEDGKPVQREIDYRDKKGRSISSELYRLKSDNRNALVGETINFRTKTLYDGDRSLFSWTIYDDTGKLNSQMYVLREDHNELARLNYRRRHQRIEGSTENERSNPYLFERLSPEVVEQLKLILKIDECVEDPNWIPDELETRAYKFDGSKNIIQYKFQEREKTSHLITDNSIHEQDITYYPAIR